MAIHILNIMQSKFIKTNPKFAGGWGGGEEAPVVVFVVSHLQNVKSVSSPVILETWPESLFFLI